MTVRELEQKLSNIVDKDATIIISRDEITEEYCISIETKGGEQCIIYQEVHYINHY
jgi:hypothetical protein